MPIKFLFFAFIVFMILSSANADTNAQEPAIRFYPYGEVISCPGCGHLGMDLWRVKFRLENNSGTDLTVYGYWQDDKLQFLAEVLDLNPGTCDWKYDSGTNIAPASWNEKSRYLNESVVLKSGSVLESEEQMRLGHGNTRRFSAYLSKPGDPEPSEVSSDPFIFASTAVPGNEAKVSGSIAPQLKIIEVKCIPLCSPGLERSPSVLGVRLGMTVAEVIKQIPDIKIGKADTNDMRSASVWNFKEDAYMIYVTFFHNEVSRIETRFSSLKGKRIEKNFFELVAQRLGLPGFTSSFNSGFECQDFVVSIITNEVPNITIWKKSFIEINRKFVEDSYRK